MYEIERKKFIETFKRLDPDNLIIEAFEEGEVLKTENFVFVCNEGDVSIIRLDSLDGEPQVVNWYKLYHLGRALNLKGFTNNFSFYRFIADVVKDLKERKRK